MIRKFLRKFGLFLSYEDRVDRTLFYALCEWHIAARSIPAPQWVRSSGLCIAVPSAPFLRKFHTSSMCMDVKYRLKELLQRDFGNSVTPFGGPGRYLEDKRHQEMHHNLKRLAWVRKIIAELDKS